MKTKRQNHHRGWKQALSVLLVFALAAGLVLSAPALSGVAYAAPVLQDVGEEGGSQPEVVPAEASGAGALKMEDSCTVKVDFPKTMTGEDVTELDEENTLTDLYLIAPAVRLSGHEANGYDVYAFCVDNGMPYYAWVKDYVEHTEGWRAQEYDSAPDGYPKQNENAAKWLVFFYSPDTEEENVQAQAGLAELMAKVCFAPELLPEQKDASGAAIPKPTALAAAGSNARTKIGVKSHAVSAGLYLNTVHHDLARWEDYVVLVHQKDVPEGTPDKVCTIAYSDTKVYTFQPQLVSLPGRVDAAGNVQTDALQAGAWDYHMTVTAKGEAADRFADLLIEKQLTNTVSNGSAMFVFRVKAYKPGEENGGKPVYETVVTLREGKMTSDVIMGKIPAGSTVVITEEYSGLGYRFDQARVSASWNDPGLTGGPAVTGTPAENGITIKNIPAGRIHLTAPAGGEKILQDGATETVTVTNAPDTTISSGGSVVNSFTPGENNGWTWTQSSYDAETGKWNVTNTDTTGTTPAAPAEGEG